MTGLIITVIGLCAIAPPPTMTVQGQLRSAGGAAVDGSYDLDIRLYQSADAELATWEEEHEDTPVVGGIFSLRLGVQTPLDASIVEAADALWVEVQVESDPPLPRRPLDSVPWALAALRAATASSIDCAACIGSGQLAAAAVTAEHLAAGVPASLGLALAARGCSASLGRAQAIGCCPWGGRCWSCGGAAPGATGAREVRTSSGCAWPAEYTGQGPPIPPKVSLFVVGST